MASAATQTATEGTARRTFHLRRAVHVAIAGAEHTLCGIRLIGAIDTEFPASCPDCATHTFETVPGLWAKVAPIGDGDTFTGHIDGLPEATGAPEATGCRTCGRTDGDHQPGHSCYWNPADR